MRRFLLGVAFALACGAAAVGASAQLLSTHAGRGVGGGGGAAIALVNASNGANNSGASNSLTYAYTAGTRPHSLLVVCVTGDVGGGSDDITGVTYNSLPMTRAVAFSASSPLRYMYLYYLVAAAGWGGVSQNVVVSASTNHWLLSVIGEYSGVSQSGSLDATGQGVNTSGSNVAYNITTVANNVWLMTCGEPAGGGGMSTGTNTDFLRATSPAPYNKPSLFDHGAAVSPAGSQSTTVNGSDSNTVGITASFAPG